MRRTTCPVRFGYVGRLHPSKGLVELAHAVRAIPADIDFRLDIRGPMIDQDSRTFAAELQALLAGESRVTFGPGIPGADVPAVLAELDALLCPSMWFENGPTIALEAIAVGTPIIASRVGNLAEIVEDGVNGQLVAPGNVEQWSAALARVATEPSLTIDRWRSVLPRPRTMDEIARDYLELYRSVRLPRAESA
jgi:glycosyltransferase involved in cell wall biosynthesis